MDSFLDYLGLYRSDVAKDSTCLFRAVSEQLFYTQFHYVKLRECCVEYMDRNRTEFEALVKQDFDEYLEKIKNGKEWAGEVEMKALSSKYKVDFEIYCEINDRPLTIKAHSSLQKITLACTGGNRYDCVYSKSDLSSLAFCQSIVYEMLYKDVFQLGSDVDVAVEKMLHDKAYSKQRKNNLLCHYFRESCRIDGMMENPVLTEAEYQVPLNPRLEIRRALAQGVPPFPYKVAKTLDQGIYRNVEFDMWNEKRKEDHKNEQFIIPKLEPGVKCKVYLHNDVFIGHIQEIFKESESVSVYIEELCKRCIVPINVLEVVAVPAYKAMTFRGGKTYKVSECFQSGPESEKNKPRRNHKKNYQDQSPTHKENSNSLKPNIIARSNSLPASDQRNSGSRNNNFYSSPLMPRKKGHSISIPSGHRSKNSKDSRNNGPLPQPNRSKNFPCMWNGMPTKLSTSPIPIPGKVPDCFQHPQAGSPEMLSEDPRWTEEVFKRSTPSHFSPPPPYTLTPAYSDQGYSTMSAGSPFALIPANGATLPLPIPGTQTPTPPLVEDVQTTLGQPAMAVYHPYPVYTMPGMYLVCRDGSAVPVNIGAPWAPQEGVNGEAPPGVPSVYFNTPPTGLSPPPVACFIPGSMANNGTAWTPAMSSAVAFNPPLEMNAYHSMMSPPWSPPSGVYIPPPAPVAYQIQQGQAHGLPPKQEPAHK